MHRQALGVSTHIMHSECMAGMPCQPLTLVKISPDLRTRRCLCSNQYCITGMPMTGRFLLTCGSLLSSMMHRQALGVSTTSTAEPTRAAAPTAWPPLLLASGRSTRTYPCASSCISACRKENQDKIPWQALQVYTCCTPCKEFKHICTVSCLLRHIMQQRSVHA